MNRILDLSLVAVLAVWVSGCATVFKGKTEDVNFTSTNKDMPADVYVNGVFRGKTPLKVALSTADSQTVEFRRTGFLGISYQLSSTSC